MIRTFLGNDIYNAPQKSVLVMCHTSKGDPKDMDGRYFEAGEEYWMGTEIIKPSKDTNNQECILCWISFNEGFGSRFAVKGNIYRTLEDRALSVRLGTGHNSEPYWPDFKDYFICPVARVRDEQLEKLGL